MPRTELFPKGRADHMAQLSRLDEVAEAAGLRAGLTTADVARLLRVSKDKVRGWIASGDLVATNTAAARSGKPRWVISPESLAAFRARRTSAPPPKPVRRRRKDAEVDFFPG